MPNISSLSVSVIFAMIYLLQLPMSFCQCGYFKTITLFPASILKIGTMMAPVLGIYSSYLVLDEAAI